MADTATTTVAPWAPLQPYLTQGFQQAGNLLNAGGPNYYPASTVAGFGSGTMEAANQIQSLARAGTPVTGAAQQQVTGTLQGDYLNSNPYLDAMYNNAASAVTRNYSEAVAPQLAANFGLSGRTGSNMAFANTMNQSQDTLSRNLGGMAADIYGGAYENERNRQMQAAQLAPQTAALNYYDANQYLNLGNMFDQMNQAKLDDEVNRFNFNQNQPYDNLGRYMGYLGGQYGNTTTQPIFQNKTAQNLGLASAGLGLATEYGGSVFDFLSGLF